MALIGLFCANHAAADGSGDPSALLRVGGISLLERNLRLALKAGATRLVVLAEELSPALVEELTALHRRYPLDVVRVAEQLAGKVEPEDRVLLIEEGFVVDQRLVNRAALFDEPTVISIWNAGPAVPERAVRLTAQYFSAAVSILPGHLVRRIAKGLGDWDFEQTVLRSAMVDLEPHYLDAAGCAGFVPMLGRDVPLLWHAVSSQADAALADQSLSGTADTIRGDAPTRWVYGPLARQALLHSGKLRLSAAPVAWVGAGLGAVAVVALFLGWFWAGVICAILMGFAFELSHRIEQIRLDSAAPGWLLNHAPRLLEAGWYAGLCGAFVKTQGMAAVAVALLLLVCRLSADLHRHYFHRLFQSSLDDAPGVPRLIGLLGSGAQTNMWLLLCFGIAGAWYGGFWAVAGYSALTYGFVLGVFVLRLKQMVQRRAPGEEPGAGKLRPDASTGVGDGGESGSDAGTSA